MAANLPISAAGPVALSQSADAAQLMEIRVAARQSQAPVAPEPVPGAAAASDGDR